MFSDAGQAFDAFDPGARAASATQPRWRTGDAVLPAIYLSHGAPPLFNEREWMDRLLAWATGMPKPTGILIVSAHWESAPITVSAPTPATPLVYDFGGFHPRFFAMTYPTPDAAGLGRQVRQLLGAAGPVHESARGLDHGAWVPLKVMYPLGDVPVVQVSLPTHDAGRLLALGGRLRPLREQGVLIVGSGFMTHGLPFLTPEMMAGGHVPGWSADFDAWAWQALRAGDVDTLAGFRQRAPGMPFAHPTVEHFTPLFVTLGAATDPGSVRSVIDGTMWGLSRRSVELD